VNRDIPDTEPTLPKEDFLVKTARPSEAATEAASMGFYSQ
jgi:hypothetical protein